MKKLTGVLLESYLGILIICSAYMVNAAKSDIAKTSNFSLTDLKENLSKIILKKYPDAYIDRRGERLTIYFRSNNYKTHITDENRNLSKEPSNCFPSDFSEFKLDININSDYYTYTHKSTFPSERSETFGATFMNGYNLKILPDDIPSTTTISDTPFHRWLYSAYDLLSKAGLLYARTYGTCMGGCLGMTRMEFAVATARLTDKDNLKAHEKINKNPELKKALKVLQREFAPELAKLGLHSVGLNIWPTRYEYLSLDFSYGKGFDPELRKQIEHTIADYTAAWLKSNSSTAAATQK
jgi:hypothetical protein